MVWWQGASLLGRWDSNQSALPRGASDHRARRPNCPGGRPAGSAAATHVHRGAGAAMLAALLSVWITFLGQMGTWMNLSTTAIWMDQWNRKKCLFYVSWTDHILNGGSCHSSVTTRLNFPNAIKQHLLLLWRPVRRPLYDLWLDEKCIFYCKQSGSG